MAVSPEIEGWFRDALKDLLRPHKIAPGTKPFEESWALLRGWVECRARQFEADPAKLVDFVRRRRPKKGASPEEGCEGEPSREEDVGFEERLRSWFAHHRMTAETILRSDPDKLTNPSLAEDDRPLVRQWLVRTRDEYRTAMDLFSRCAVMKTAAVDAGVRAAMAESAARPPRLEDARWSLDDAFDEAWIARIYGEGPGDECEADRRRGSKRQADRRHDDRRDDDVRYARFRGHVVLRLNIPKQEAKAFIHALYVRLHPNQGGRWREFRPQAAGFVTFAKLEARSLARQKRWRDLRFPRDGVALDDSEVRDTGKKPEEIRTEEEEARFRAALRNARWKWLLRELFVLDSAPHQIITFAFHRLSPKSDAEVARLIWRGRLGVLLKLLGEHSVPIDGKRVPLSTFLDPKNRANVAFRITQPVRRVLKKVQLFPTRRPTKNYAECFGALVRVGNSAGEMEFRRGDEDNRRRFARFLRTETGQLRLCDFALSGGPTSNVRKFSSAVMKRLVNRARAIERRRSIKPGDARTDPGSAQDEEGDE